MRIRLLIWQKLSLFPFQNTRQYPRVGQNWSYNSWSAPISVTRRYFDLMKGWYGEVKDFPAANVNPLSYKGTTGVTTHYTQVELTVIVALSGSLQI